MMKRFLCLILPYCTRNNFLLEIHHLVLLSITEAFDPLGSARTDIKSAGCCRETEKNS